MYIKKKKSLNIYNIFFLNNYISLRLVKLPKDSGNVVISL